jgi:hypothetical protein
VKQGKVSARADGKINIPRCAFGSRLKVRQGESSLNAVGMFRQCTAKEPTMNDSKERSTQFAVKVEITQLTQAGQDTDRLSERF